MDPILIDALRHVAAASLTAGVMNGVVPVPPALAAQADVTMKDPSLGQRCLAAWEVHKWFFEQIAASAGFPAVFPPYVPPARTPAAAPASATVPKPVAVLTPPPVTP